MSITQYESVFPFSLCIEAKEEAKKATWQKSKHGILSSTSSKTLIRKEDETKRQSFHAPVSTLLSQKIVTCLYKRDHSWIPLSSTFSFVRYPKGGFFDSHRDFTQHKDQLTFIWYLSGSGSGFLSHVDEEGGETKFVEERKIIYPCENSMIVFPPHLVHRSRPAKKEKLVLVGTLFECKEIVSRLDLGTGFNTRWITEFSDWTEKEVECCSKVTLLVCKPIEQGYTRFWVIYLLDAFVIQDRNGKTKEWVLRNVKETIRTNAKYNILVTVDKDINESEMDEIMKEQKNPNFYKEKETFPGFN